MISLLFFIRNPKATYRPHRLQDLQMLTATADPELSGVISLLFLRRNLREKEGKGRKMKETCRKGKKREQ